MPHAQRPVVTSRWRRMINRPPLAIARLNQLTRLHAACWWLLLPGSTPERRSTHALHSTPLSSAAIAACCCMHGDALQARAAAPTLQPVLPDFSGGGVLRRGTPWQARCLPPLCCLAAGRRAAASMAAHCRSASSGASCGGRVARRCCMVARQRYAACKAAPRAPASSGASGGSLALGLLLLLLLRSRRQGSAARAGSAQCTGLKRHLQLEACPALALRGGPGAGVRPAGSAPPRPPSAARRRRA